MIKSNTYGITEVGKMLCVHRATILRYVNAGIEGYKVADNGRKTFSAEDIAELRVKMYDLCPDEAIHPTTKRYNLLWKHGGKRRIHTPKNQL